MLHVTISHRTTDPRDMPMPIPVAVRVQKRRSALRLSGLRPVQIWVPDTRQPGFAAQCKRQSALAAKSDLVDLEMLQFMDAVLSDLDGWAA